MKKSQKYLISTRIKSTWPKNKKSTLIFSAVSALDKYDGLQSNYKSFRINDYHWKNKKKLGKDFKYLSKYYERLLSHLSYQLNNLHGKNYSKLFWRILIGPWLGTFLHVYFDRWNNVIRLLKKDKIDKVIFLKLNKEILIPYDNKELNNLFENDFWNQQLYQYVISDLLNKKKIKFKKINQSKLKQSLSHTRGYISHDITKPSLKNYLKKIINFTNTRDYKYLFYSTYLGSINEMQLSYKFNQLPVLFYNDKFKTENKISYEKRKLINLNLRTKNNFEKSFTKNFPKQIPKVFLENFNDLVNFSINSNLPQNPKTIFSSNALWYDSKFSFHVAHLKEKKVNLYYAQHGGAYGISKYSWPESHEKKIADKYLTWGWTDKEAPNKIKKFYIFSNIKNFKKDKKKENLLILLRHRKRYFNSLESSAGTEVYSDYMKFCSDFLFNLSKEIKFKTILRLPNKISGESVDFFSNLRKNFKFYSQNSFQEACNKSKLIVNTANSTTLLETLSANFPTIIILDKKTNPIRSNAKKYIRMLYDNKILHYNSLSAAKFVNEVWNSDINDWWNYGKTQKAIKKFCKVFANKKENFLVELKKILE